MVDHRTHLFINQHLILKKQKKKKGKGNDYVLSWKSEGVFNSKLKPLYTALLNSIILSDYRIGKNLLKIL